MSNLLKNLNKRRIIAGMAVSAKPVLRAGTRDHGTTGPRGKAKAVILKRGEGAQPLLVDDHCERTFGQLFPGPAVP
ncbi:MAG TPA: hypothetical protein VNX47_09720, partial [Nevskia sp.]|nr:hypothetical protein [Nevskia sp.]